jgi:hypothetical protein
VVVTGDSSDIEELEVQYQSEQILQGEGSINGEIVDAAIVGTEVRESVREGSIFETRYSFYLLIEIPNGQQYGATIREIFDPDGDDLVTLYRLLGVPPDAALDRLVGNTIGLSLPTQGQERIGLSLGGSQINAHRTDDIKQIREGDMELPPTVEVAHRRAYKYTKAADEEIGVRVPVTGISADDDRVIVDLADGWGSISVELDTTQETDPETPYERLVEYAGYGSVSQIEEGDIRIAYFSELSLPDKIYFKNGGTLANSKVRQARTDQGFLSDYATPTPLRDHLDTFYDEFIMLEEDRTGVWAVFGSADSLNPNFPKYTIAAVVILLLLLAVALL